MLETKLYLLQKEIFSNEVICANDFLSIPLKLPKKALEFANEEVYKSAAKRVKVLATTEGDRLRAAVDTFLKEQAGGDVHGSACSAH